MKTGLKQLGVLMLGGAAMVMADAAVAKHRGDDTVLIGGAISMTGRYSEPAGRNFNSIKLWVEDVNKRGGLLGHVVKFRAARNADAVWPVIQSTVQKAFPACTPGSWSQRLRCGRMPADARSVKRSSANDDLARLELRFWADGLLNAAAVCRRSEKRLDRFPAAEN